ncbi:hypothetical protein [Sandaracinus amylolyticus]|uniref:Uncharacterized protein n=1 Tax=Sandaracinus amylolyticus TaxID=927083 RepID=A0A0F6W2X0_9BACT|nr:hypothetical protein [Sandaracinus amylolyticus]AKF06087.1 hypothetical protein DB32_003236 [Sandaracinus amylolyticus]
MPQNITDTSTFTDPIVIPADADPADLTYIETLAQGLANRTRFLRDYCTDQGVQLPAATQHIRYIGAQAAQPGMETDGAPRWRARLLGAPPDNFDGAWRSNASFAELFLDLTPRLVRGGTLIRVRALVRPGATLAARGGAGNGVQAAVFGVSFGASFAAPAITTTHVGTTDEDDGTTNLQWLQVDLAPSGVAVSTYATWYLRLYAGVDGDTNRDFFYGAMVEVASPTIRND